MDVEEISFEAEEKMEKAVEFLRAEFRGIRTGRASTSLVEHIKVDYYGSTAPLKQVANLSTPEANLIVIKPFDASSLKDIEKAIIASSLGVTPSNDGRIVRLLLPPLSGERRTMLAQQIKQMAEQGRVSIRNSRRDANKQLDQAEKNKTISEDERDEAKKDMDELTKKYVAKIDEVLQAKTDEIMEI
ncbi:MAG: ribosome recycling factor [Sedimentisphaerales bacterium]|nr:ribosome recycling factor [Sedimentisphaerales bacterium]